MQLTCSNYIIELLNGTELSVLLISSYSMASSSTSAIIASVISPALNHDIMHRVSKMPSRKDQFIPLDSIYS